MLGFGGESSLEIPGDEIPHDKVGGLGVHELLGVVHIEKWPQGSLNGPIQRPEVYNKPQFCGASGAGKKP